MTVYTIIKTSLGGLILASNKNELTGVYFHDQKHIPVGMKTWTRDDDNELLQSAAREITEYFGGKRKEFTVPLGSKGTSFQKKIWKEIAKIPFGTTISYSELAKRAGSPNAVRAAGTATGANPLGIIVPCHRVIGKDKTLTGYAGGLERKRHLLKLEGL